MQETIAGDRLCRVLVVEDDSADFFLLERALSAASKGAGVTVDLTHCGNGLEGLSSIALGDLTQRLPDIVVVDLNMPIMRGDLFLHRLRVDLALPRLPALVLTTSNEQRTHAAAKLVGANYVFTKPAEFVDLLAIADKIIDVGTRRERVLVESPSFRRVARRVAKRSA